MLSPPLVMTVFARAPSPHGLSLNVAGTWTRRPPGAFRPVVSRWGRRVALALHAGVRGAPPASGVRAPRRPDLRGARVPGSAVREARAAARQGRRRLRPEARISAAEPRPRAEARRLRPRHGQGPLAARSRARDVRHH